MPADAFALTPIDYVFTGTSAYPVGFVFHYRYRIDEDRFRDALARTLAQFPPASSRLERISEVDYRLRADPQGLVFEHVVQRDCAADERPFHTYLESAETREGEPLCRLRLTETADGTTLGISFSHVVADGFSCFYFLSELAKAFDGQTISTPELDRSWYQARTFPLPERLSRAETIALTGFARAAPRRAVPQSAVFWETLLLGEAELDDLLARASAAAPVRLSRNDVLTAHLWKTYVPKWNAGATLDLASFCLPFDARRFRDWVSGRYFGNGICLAGGTLDSERFQQADLTELALLVRHTVAKVTQDYVCTSYDAFEAIRQRDGLEAMQEFHVNDPDGGILVTNLSRVPLERVDFGQGQPFSFGTVTNAPRTAIVLPAEDGVKVEICYPTPPQGPTP